MSLSGKKFIIDPGHGGAYDGVTSGTQKEKDITLKISNALKTKLVAAGAIVYMTRTTDKDFGGSTADNDVNNRVAYINTLPAVSGLISIHINTAPLGQVGPYYYNGYVASKNFADAVATRMYLLSRPGDFAVIRDTTPASAKILIECGHIGESAWDTTEQYTTIADRILLGCQDYFG